MLKLLNFLAITIFANLNILNDKKTRNESKHANAYYSCNYKKIEGLSIEILKDKQ